jgi:hypothetical protein
MSRVPGAILSSTSGQAQLHTTNMLDLQYGGVMGWAPRYGEIDSNQQYISKNVIPILLQAPTMFKDMPGGDSLTAQLRALVEERALSIEGLNRTLTVETTDTPFGASEVQEDPTRVVRARTELTYNWNEKYGKPVNALLELWIQYGIGDPEAQFALINTLDGNRKKITDMLFDRFTMSMMFIEPDPTHSFVIEAYIGAAMYPKAGGDNTSKFDKTAGGEKRDYSIPFAGIYQTGLGVKKAAQAILDTINITNANPFTRAAMIDKISADVLKASRGYSSSVDATANRQVAVG